MYDSRFYIETQATFYDKFYSIDEFHQEHGSVLAIHISFVRTYSERK